MRIIKAICFIKRMTGGKVICLKKCGVSNRTFNQKFLQSFHEFLGNKKC